MDPTLLALPAVFVLLPLLACAARPRRRARRLGAMRRGLFEHDAQLPPAEPSSRRVAAPDAVLAADRPRTGVAPASPGARGAAASVSALLLLAACARFDGEPCETDDQCRSRLCRPSTGRCYTPCADDGGCVPGWRCGPAADGLGECTCGPATAPDLCNGLDDDCDGFPDDVVSCPAGQGCGGEAGCVSCPNAACDGRCVVLATDPRHCGGCTSRCVSGASCCDGICVAVRIDPDHCGWCGNGCPAGSGCCRGECRTDVSEDENCR